MTPLDMRKKFLNGMLEVFTKNADIDALKQRLEKVKDKEELELFIKDMNKCMEELGPIIGADKRAKMYRIQQIEDRLAELIRPFNPFQDKQDRAANKEINELNEEKARLESDIKHMD